MKFYIKMTAVFCVVTAAFAAAHYTGIHGIEASTKAFLWLWIVVAFLIAMATRGAPEGQKWSDMKPTVLPEKKLTFFLWLTLAYFLELAFLGHYVLAACMWATILPYELEKPVKGEKNEHPETPKN